MQRRDRRRASLVEQKPKMSRLFCRLIAFRTRCGRTCVARLVKEQTMMQTSLKLRIAYSSALLCALQSSIAAAGDPPKLSFLSDTDKLYQDLETLQASAYEGDPIRRQWKGTAEEFQKLQDIAKSLFPDDGPAAQAALNSHMRRILAKPLPTRWEDPLSYAITLRSDKRIVSGAKALKTDMPDPPRFGTLPLAEINAEAIALPDGYIVAINAQTYNFCHQLTRIAAATIEFKIVPGRNQLTIDPSTDAFRRRMKEDPGLGKRLDSLLRVFTTKSSPSFEKWRPPGPHEAPLIVPLVDAMETFIVGHEYTHVLLKHEPVEGVRKRLSLANSTGASKEIDAIVRSWEQELHADVGGVALLNQALEMEWKDVMPKDRHPFTGPCVRYAPVLYFQFADILEEATFINKNLQLPNRRTKASEEEVRRLVDKTRPLPKALADILSIKSIKMKAVDKEAGAHAPLGASSKEFVDEHGDHPPAWIRQSVIEQEWIAAAAAGTPEQKDMCAIAAATGRNIRLLWDEIKPVYLRHAVEAARLKQ